MFININGYRFVLWIVSFQVLFQVCVFLFFFVSRSSSQTYLYAKAGVDFSIQFKAFPMKNQPRTFEERRAAVSTIHEPMLIRAVDSSPLPARNDLPMFLAFKNDRAFCALVMRKNRSMIDDD